MAATLALGCGVGCGRLDFSPRASDAGEPVDGATTADTAIDGATVVVSLGARADATGAARDTMIQQTRPGDGFGGHPDLHLDSTDLDARPLLWFDTTPARGRVVSARLRLWVKVSNAGASSSISAFPLTESWTEGNEDYTPGLANYTLRDAGQQWTSPGAEAPSRQALAAGVVSGAFVVGEALDIPLAPATVQAWVDEPTSNHGVVLVPAQLGYSELHTREAVDEAVRPLLVLELE